MRVILKIIYKYSSVQFNKQIQSGNLINSSGGFELNNHLNKQNSITAMSQTGVLNLEPYKYIHVLDRTTNITRLEVGPLKFVRKDHEMVVSDIQNYIKLKPRHYCIIKNPKVMDGKAVVLNEFHEAVVRFGEIEVRTQEDYSEPFPLYPYEVLDCKPLPYVTVNSNTALLLKAVRPFTDQKNKAERFVDDEYLFFGPATYIPRVEEVVVSQIKATVIKPNEALVVKAKKAMKDNEGTARRPGEKWIVRTNGSYMPNVNEDILEVRKAHVLTDKKCIHLRAIKDMTDVYSIKRKGGQEWLVGIQHAETHILDVKEQFVSEVKITSLTNRQYCNIVNPIVDGKRRFGEKELRKGEMKFFLQPGEELENGQVNDVIVLGDDEALLLKATTAFKDEDGTVYKPGSVWMKLGPCDFIPPIGVEVIEQRKSFPLDKNEGIYVRNKRTGEVKMISGQTYMLSAHEELWKKPLSEYVEKLISEGVDQLDYLTLISITPKKRDYSRVVTFKAAQGSAVQLYDFKTNQTRIVFGPEHIMLAPYENITVLSLSGGQPIQEGFLRVLSIELGPSQIRDQIIVETVDHARLILDLSYNWEFRFNKADKDDISKIFQNKDYIGNACKAMSSRIRGVISGKTFDNFHKNSHNIIKGAVLKTDDVGNIIPFVFEENNFCITDINSSGYRPVDKETEESLQRSFKMSLDIQTKAKEAEAKNQQLRLEQEGFGQLERQRIVDDINSMVVQKQLLEQQAESAIVRQQGQAIADARARAEAKSIAGTAEVAQALNKVKASTIRRKAELELLQQRMETEIVHMEAVDDLEISSLRELADIEAKKFEETIQAIGRDTIIQMARAGPETQARLLKGLGLQGFMVIDGKNPINLFNTANGLMGQDASGALTN